ncbi:MAG: DUF4838 domain-containing protein [Armatimonadota bacterium]
MMKLTKVLLALALLTVAAGVSSAEDLTLRYKPLFPKVGAYPLLSGHVESGAVSVDDTDFVSEKPSLRLDCTKTKERVIAVGCYLNPAKLAPYKGKAVVFRGQVKWLQGQGQVMLQMRASGEKLAGTIAQQTVLKPEPGKWVPFELHATIPPMPEANIVNFMVWLENSQQPGTMLVDELMIEADTATETKTARSGFAAYERSGVAEPLVLVRDGKPVASIVVGDKLSMGLRFALQELQEHLKLSTGTELPVLQDGQPASGPTLHLGKTAFTERLGLSPSCFAPDNWTVQRVGDAIVLSGGDSPFDIEPVSNSLYPYGTLYAVYEFLERQLGVRWFWPGELGRIVPKHSTLSVGNVAWYGTPSYNTRFAFYSIPKDPDFKPRDAQVWWRRMRWGGLNGSPIGMHSFNQWPKRFGDTHPEWFAVQRNGQRAAHDPGGYVCFSNSEVFAQTVADMRELFDKRPEMRYATVMPGDGMFECRCEKCQAQVGPEEPKSGRWSKLVWTFVNNVAAEVRKTHPDRIVTCCAYSEYREPPADVYLLPNVAISLCTNYLPNVWQENGKQEYLKELSGWATNTSDLYVWDYWYARRGAGTYGAPSIFPHAMQEWFALERGRVKGRVIELCEFWADGRSSSDWADWMMDSLNMYVAMRLMWDLDQDVDKIIDEYCQQLYGPAAPLLRKFYTELETAWADPTTKGGGEKPVWDWSTCWLNTYPPDLVQRTMGYLREAEKSTRGQEPYHARVAKTLTGFLPFEANSQRYSAAAGAPVTNEKIVVPLTQARPVIDGNIDDACWQAGVPVEGLFDMYNSPNLRSQTTMKMLRDEANLYVSMRAPLESNERKQTVTPGSRDANVWDDESCEVFLVQGPKRVQFLLGPQDIFADNYQPDLAKDFTMDAFKWDCKGVQYKTAVGEKLWTAELLIPLASLELSSPTKDAPWKVNFCRNYYYRLPGQALWQWETSSWRPAFGSFHNVERYGEMWFE